ncbi:hypothetical protein [Streptomyces sp. NPDC000878]
MRLEEKEVDCQVRLTITGTTGSDLEDLVSVARKRGNTVDLTPLPSNGVQITATFGEDVTGAQQLINGIEKRSAGHP